MLTQGFQNNVYERDKEREDDYMKVKKEKETVICESIKVGRGEI